MSDDNVPAIVSRETSERLKAFAQLVIKWNPRINLVSRGSLPDLCHRHIADSRQLWTLHDNPQRWVDLGSGGGFPGIVIACCQASGDVNNKTILIESDKRKAVFLNTAVQQLQLSADVVPKRIEDVPSQQATTLTARALAPLDVLLGYAQLHLAHGGVAIFPKGENWQKEVDKAKGEWSFECDVIQSVTDAKAAILKIKNINRR